MESVVPAQLQRLVKKADATAEKADAFVRRAIRSLQAELTLLAKEKPIEKSATAREEVYKTVRARMGQLGKRLSALLAGNLEYAAKQAAKRTQAETGVEVRYSKKYADEVIALVSPDQGENLAAVFTDKMGKNIISSLRLAVVNAFRENAVAGGTLKELSRIIDENWQKTAKKGEVFRFMDSAGRVWDTKTYMAMNTRTNAMRVYNDCLCAELADATGSDLVRVSTGGDPHCKHCKPWEGRILSVTGRTKGFPTYEEAKAAGCFHPNCVHTLEYVDELIDDEDITAQRGSDAPDKTPDPMKSAFDLAVSRRMRDGVSEKAATVEIARERLREAIRGGLPFEGTEDAVDDLTDDEVLKIVGNGHPPEFQPTKGSKRKREPEKYNRGSAGGVVHINRDKVTADHIREIMGL